MFSKMPKKYTYTSWTVTHPGSNLAELGLTSLIGRAHELVFLLMVAV